MTAMTDVRKIRSGRRRRSVCGVHDNIVVPTITTHKYYIIGEKLTKSLCFGA